MKNGLSRGWKDPNHPLGRFQYPSGLIFEHSALSLSSSSQKCVKAPPVAGVSANRLHWTDRGLRRRSPAALTAPGKPSTPGDRPDRRAPRHHGRQRLARCPRPRVPAVHLLARNSPRFLNLLATDPVKIAQMLCELPANDDSGLTLGAISRPTAVTN